MSISVKPKPTAITQYAVPAFLAESNPNLPLFIDYYFRWLAQSGNPVDLLQNLIEYKDINSTTPQFASLITQQLMDFVPATANIDQAFLAHHIKEFYQAKGSLPSYEFIMNLLYGGTAKINHGADLVFRPSAAAYTQNDVLFVTPTNTWSASGCIGSYVNQTYPSLAEAIVESVTLLSDGNYQLNFDHSTLQGNFDSAGIIQILSNVTDRSYYNVKEYYTLQSLSGSTLTVSAPFNTIQYYPGYIVRQVGGSNFRGVVSAAIVNQVSYGFQFVLTLTSITGTLGTSQIYLIPASLENLSYTTDNFYYGTVSPIVADVTLTNTGNYFSVGDNVNLIGGSGTPFIANVGAIKSGTVDSIFVVNGGYGYSVGDTTTSSASGLIASVSAIDGTGAQLEPVLMLDGYQLVNGGYQYAVGDKIYVSGGLYETSPTYFTVAGINTTPALYELLVSKGGNGYKYCTLALLNTNTNTLMSGFAAAANFSMGGAINSAAISTYPTLTGAENLKVLVNGYGASATATTASGAISTISISASGFNYVNPIVLVTSSTPPLTPAQFSVTLAANGGVTGISIVNGGAGYPATVTISIVEMYGSGAVITPIIGNANLGPVSSLTVAGSGDYTELPSCFNTPTLTNSASGFGIEINLKYKFKSVDLLNAGYNFTTSLIDTTYGIGQDAVISPNIQNGVIGTVSAVTQGSGYTFANVFIVSSTGSGFSAVATISGGQITGYTIKNRGAGYAATDQIVVQGNGVNATASFTIFNGAVTSFTIINAGKNYAYDTTLSYSMDAASYPNAVSGTFIPQITNGELASITVTYPGSGYVADKNELMTEASELLLLEQSNTYLDYDSPYDVPLLSSSGRQAIVSNFIGNGEEIVSATVTSGGMGYYSTAERTPISVTPSSLTGKHAILLPNIENGALTSIYVYKGGNGYSISDTLAITGTGTGATASLTVVNGVITAATVTGGGSGYVYGTKIYVDSDGVDINLLPIVDTSISIVTVTNGGSGYVSSDVVTVNDATGTGAVLFPVVVNGSITQMMIVNGGIGYTSPIISVAGGTGATFSSTVTRAIAQVEILDGGDNASYADAFVYGDGYGAEIALAIDNKSITNPQLVISGGGYVATPNVLVTDASNYGSVSAVDVYSSSLYIDTPYVYLNNKYNLTGGLTATGAKLIANGANIGAIDNVLFNSYSDGWNELPYLTFPFTALVNSVPDFKVGEEVFVYNDSAVSLDASYRVLAEDGSIIDYELLIGHLDQEDGVSGILTEASEYLDVEAQGPLDEEYYPYAGVVPSGYISTFDIDKNRVKIVNATDELILVSENENEFISETGITLLDEISGGFGVGDKIVGSITGLSATIAEVNRATGLAVQSGYGDYPRSRTNSSGVFDSTISVIHNNADIQDFAYTLKSNIQYSEYRDTIIKTVHPAGFGFYGEYALQNASYLGNIVVTTPVGKTSQVTSKIKWSDSYYVYGNQNIGLEYYDATKDMWYVTPGSVLENYTFNQFDPSASTYLSSIQKPVYYESFLSNGVTTNTAGSSGGTYNITGLTSSQLADITIGYRVFSWDVNGNSIFKDNYILAEDGVSNILTEDGSYIDTDEFFTYVMGINNVNNIVFTSKNAINTLNNITVWIENYPEGSTYISNNAIALYAVAGNAISGNGF